MFASYGLPTGDCGSYVVSSSCNFVNSASVVGSLCLGKSNCTILAQNNVFGFDPCISTVKLLAVQLTMVAISSGTRCCIWN